MIDVRRNFDQILDLDLLEKMLDSVHIIFIWQFDTLGSNLGGL